MNKNYCLIFEVLNYISKRERANFTDILIISNTQKKFYKQIFKTNNVNYLTSHNQEYILQKSFDYNADLIILQDIHLTQKNYYIQLLSALISIKPNGTIIIKLKLPLIDYPLLNLLYIIYSSVTHFKVVKPVVCNQEFYVIASNFKELQSIDFEHLYIIANTYFI